MVKKYTAYVYVSNDSGEKEWAGSSNNLAMLKRLVRAKYGKGWMVVIYKQRQWLPPIEVEQFTIRK